MERYEIYFGDMEERRAYEVRVSYDKGELLVEKLVRTDLSTDAETELPVPRSEITRLE